MTMLKPVKSKTCFFCFLHLKTFKDENWIKKFPEKKIFFSNFKQSFKRVVLFYFYEFSIFFSLGKKKQNLKLNYHRSIFCTKKWEKDIINWRFYIPFLSLSHFSFLFWQFLWMSLSIPDLSFQRNGTKERENGSLHNNAQDFSSKILSDKLIVVGYFHC